MRVYTDKKHNVNKKDDVDKERFHIELLDYCLEKSQVFPGENILLSVFRNYTYWVNYYHDYFLRYKNCQNKNILQLSLEYILPKVKSLKPTKCCWHCGDSKHPVHFLALKDYGGFLSLPDITWTSCKEDPCKQTLERQCNNKTLHNLSFESFWIHSHTGNKKPIDPDALQALLVEVYQLGELNNNPSTIDYLKDLIVPKFRHKTKSA